MDRACARARCWEHHYNQPQGGLVWAFFAEHSGPSFSFIILSAVHLITKERHVLMGIVGVCLWTTRARARVGNATKISQAGLVWAFSFLRTVGHPSIFIILSAMHLITKKDMFVDRVRVRARWLLLRARNASRSTVRSRHRQ